MVRWHFSVQAPWAHPGSLTQQAFPGSLSHIFHESQLCICFTSPGVCLANLRVEIKLLKPLSVQNVCDLTLVIRKLFIAFSKLILAVIYYTTFNVFVYTVRCYTAFDIFMQSHALLRSIDSCSHMLHCIQHIYCYTALNVLMQSHAMLIRLSLSVTNYFLLLGRHPLRHVDVQWLYPMIVSNTAQWIHCLVGVNWG